MGTNIFCGNNSSQCVPNIVFHLADRVARRYIFVPKLPIWVNFGGPWNGKCWHIFCPIGIFNGYLIYFRVIWYILWSFLYIYFPPFWYGLPRKIWQPCLQIRRPFASNHSTYSTTVTFSFRYVGKVLARSKLVHVQEKNIFLSYIVKHIDFCVLTYLYGWLQRQFCNWSQDWLQDRHCP
jgi:hypothetical protein